MSCFRRSSLRPLLEGFASYFCFYTICPLLIFCSVNRVIPLDIEFSAVFCISIRSVIDENELYSVE